MTIEITVDDRENLSHAIRIKGSRRINKFLYHFLTRPFKDSNGRWVIMDRRSGNDRRII